MWLLLRLHTYTVDIVENKLDKNMIELIRLLNNKLQKDFKASAETISQ